MDPADNATTHAAAGPPTALVRALRTLLRPLVRFLVARQVPYPFLANLLKGVYVEVAQRDFGLAGKRLTDSRISLLTGVYRRDVKRVRAELSTGTSIPPTVSLGAEIAAHWNGLPEFLDAEGRPNPLPMYSEDEPSIETLVASVSTDIPARSVLDEWLRLGVVHFDDSGRVVLDAGAFVPQKGLEEKLYYFGRNLRDHIAAAAHNVQGEEPPFVERSVYYSRLSAASVAEIGRFAAEQGMTALQAVNRLAIELQERDAQSATETRRMTFGVYYFGTEAEPMPDEEPSDA